MAGSLVLLPAILLASLVVLLAESTPPSTTTLIAAETSCENHHNNRQLMFELEEAKLKIARLESIFEETVKGLNAKCLYLKESEKLIKEITQEMDRLQSINLLSKKRREKLIKEITQEMDRLQSALSSLKDESSRANERLNQLEEEVRLLWATLRKTNFELHFLESKAQDAENRVELVTSKVETMAAIVTEQWIQIQQLDQALHMAEMRTLQVKEKVRRCTFVKFVRNQFGHPLQKLMGIPDSFLFDKESTLGSYVSQALHQIDTILSAAKKYHHELQSFVRQEMEKNEFTAALANKEVVFFVASALITFPLLSAWMLLSSQFS